MKRTPSRLRVVHVSDAMADVHESVGGAEHAARRLLDEDMLEMTGVEARLVTAPHSRPAPFGFEVVSPATLDRIGLAGRSLRPAGWWSRRLHFDPVAHASLSGAFARLRPHVVHLHNFKLFTWAAVTAAAAQDIPLVLTHYDYWAVCPTETMVDHDGEPCTRYHGPWCHRCLPGADPVRRAALASRRSVFDAFLGLIHRHVVLSDASRRLLEVYGIDPGRIRVVPLVVHPFDARRAPSGGRLLYVGWIQERKGLLMVLDALARVRSRLPEASLDVVGEAVEPSYERRVLERADRPDLAGSVRFHGRLEHGAIGALMQGASALCIAERWPNMSPVIAVEAMGSGRPVVAFGVGGLPDVIRDGETGFVVEPFDTIAYADALLALLLDPGLADRMGGAARVCYEDRYSRRSISRRLRIVYEEALRAGGGHG